MPDEKVRYEYRYNPPKNGSTRVSINSNCYGTQIKQAVVMAAYLRNAIPFDYEADEPEIKILGGNRVKHIMAVEFTIRYTIADAQAAKLFKKIRNIGGMEWREGMEVTL